MVMPSDRSSIDTCLYIAETYGKQYHRKKKDLKKKN
jgi:hypothetical protein